MDKNVVKFNKQYDEGKIRQTYSVRNSIMIGLKTVYFFR